MGRILLKSAIAVAGIIALLLAWIAGARSLSMVLDQVHTVPLDSQRIQELGLENVSGGILRINDLPMSTVAPDNKPYPLEIKIDPTRQFVVKSGGHSIILGRIDDSLGRNSPVLKPDFGDRARFSINRSMLSWPTPLAFNFMTGQSPSWKRHLYYRLVWAKPNGNRLLMEWRYEQYFYHGWASGFMTRAGTTGLIRVDIRP